MMSNEAATVAVAAALDEDGGETFRFVVTVQGDSKQAKLTTETFLVAADGSTREAGPTLSREGESFLVSLFDAGTVLQTLSLTTGVAMAARDNDLPTVVGLLGVAKKFGIPITEGTVAP